MQHVACRLQKAHNLQTGLPSNLTAPLPDPSILHRRKHPVLLQGPTSAGKTSLVAYLAAQTGHHLVRINNHEHTDLQVRC